MKKRIVNLLLIVLVSFGARAQNFTHRLPLHKVDSTGYYNVYLPLELFAVCNPNYSDIRIYPVDSKEQVPYMVQLSTDIYLKKVPVSHPVTYTVVEENARYTEIEIPVFQKYDEGQHAFYTTEKWTNNPNIKIIVGNEDGVYKEVNVDTLPKGEGFYIAHHLIYGKRGLKFRIEGPVAKRPAIKTLLNYSLENDPTAYHQIQAKWKTSEGENSHSSIVEATLPHSAPLSMVKFEFTNPLPFQRDCSLTLTSGNNQGSIFNKKTERAYYVNIGSNPVLIETENHFANAFSLLINNNDDAPLQIKSIEALAPKLFITLRLEAGINYELKCGDPDLKKPKYDIEYNSDVRTVGTLTINTPPEAIVESSAEKTRKNLLLWGALGLCIIVMGGMAFSMIKKA